MKIEQKINYGSFDKVTIYTDEEFVCTVYQEPCTKYTFIVKVPDIFLYPEVKIVYDLRTDDTKVYWIFDRLNMGIQDEKVDTVLANFQKERKFVNEVLEHFSHNELS